MLTRPAISSSLSLPAVLIVAFLFMSCATEAINAQIMRSKTSAKTAATKKVPRWPKPTQLKKELELFGQYEATEQWASRTREIVEWFCSETEVTSKAAIEGLMALQQQSQAITSLIKQISETSSAATSVEDRTELISELQRFQYRLNRRIRIWVGVIDHVNALNSKPLSVQLKQVSLSSLPANLDELLQEQNPGNTGWQEYLAWDDLIMAARVTNQDKKARTALRKAAQKFLARYYSPSLTDAQRELFQPYFSPEIIEAIRETAAGDVDHSLIMILMEAMEGKNSGRFASHLNSQYQNLLWSNDPVAHQLAGTIDSHWRNANFRVAVHERLLNQMLPQVPAMTEPVSERIQGAKVSGQSLIENQLRIALIPNPNEIALGIETIGQVTSETVAKRSGFTFQNRGLADFKVFQKLAFTRTGVTSETPLATSTARQRLIGLRGSYDRVPLLGKLSRMIAKNKAEESTPEAIELTKYRVESGAKERVEKEVDQAVNMLRRGIHDHVLSRLIAMDLEPETVQLSTSEKRIFGRYRVAGRDQMAAWQPRPTDFESDLLTVQFHQSAVNNLIERCGLNGEEFNAITLGQHIERITGVPFEAKDSEAEATFQFAKHDAIRVDFEDGIASIKFSFKKFQIGKGRAWKNVAVKVKFVPEYIGTRIVLKRDNLFEVDSKSDLRIGDQIAIRGAFKAILEPQYAFDLMPAAVRNKLPKLALGIDRLSLAEGWCGVAFDNAANVNQSVPVISPEQVDPGSWSDQLGSFQTEDSRISTPRTARRLGQ